jgi:hypothetical protein
MSVIDLYSKRVKRALSAGVDVYIYDFPTPFRVQVQHMLVAYAASNPPGFEALLKITAQLRREYGRVELTDGIASDVPEFPRLHYTLQELFKFIGYEKTDDHIVDLLEMLCVEWSRSWENKPLIEELNQRLAEAAIGFEFNNGQILRKDSEHLHQAVVLPALMLLADKRLSAADGEYRAAHEHFRRGEYGDCLSECLKCFESVLKAICLMKKWSFDPSATQRRS